MCLTIIELLVVIAIMIILISAIVIASTTLVDKARASSTQALLTVVHDAVEQFKREQTQTRGVSSNKAYHDRYGQYPPDELEVFTPHGIPGEALPKSRLPCVSRASDECSVFPSVTANIEYGQMKFYTKGLTPKDAAKEHRDLLAMIVAIEELGDASASILDGIQDRYWVPAPPDKGKPALFLDRNNDGVFDPQDRQINLIVDDWGNPIGYMAQRDWLPAPDTPAVSNNLDDWNEASTELIRINGGQPVIFSYGPDGEDQLTSGAMGETAAASLVVDFEEEGEGRHRIDQPLNADNVYADPTLKAKLARGLADIP